MGKDILFRWEDCDALKHHCGVCNKPLHHPGAKATCFGTHAEPCFRFHQIMFMRSRGHTCDMCSHIDEHHYKRHFEMCEQVRNIYGICGEDWPLIPEDEEDRGRSMARGLDAFDSDGMSSTSGEVPLRKRDRKEQKRQIRAASRTKVTTHEDVEYVDSVLHPTIATEGTEVPTNPEEIEEIEQHLKYNAQCYNHGQKRSNIRQFAHISDADIDFGAEIDRIFEALRINELVKRNERNRGLRNKELANFNAAVSNLKEQIITDLVQNKKDELEIRMRRAAFLRYANRTSFDIVDDRYADKDWKTGEKYRSAGSGSASLDGLTAVEEEVEENDFANENELRNLSTATLHDADRRHIEQSHKKLGSDGLLEEVTAVKEIRDLPAEGTPKPPPSLRIVNTNVVPSQKIKFHNPWKQVKTSVTKPTEAPRRTAQNQTLSLLIDKDLAPDDDDDWQTVGHTATPKGKSGSRTDARRMKSVLSLQIPKSSSSHATPTTARPALKPAHVGVNAWMDQDEIYKRKLAEELDRDEKQARSNVQARIEDRKTQVRITEARLQRQVEDRKLQKPQKPTEVAERPVAEHDAIESRKKKEKKKQREAQRKARRAAEQEHVDIGVADQSADGTEADVSAFEMSPVDSMFRGGGLGPTITDLHPLSKQATTLEAEGAGTAYENNDDHGLSYGRQAEEDTKSTKSVLLTKQEEPLGSGLHIIPSTRDLLPVGGGPEYESLTKLLFDLPGLGSTGKGVASFKRKSSSFDVPNSSPTIPTTKIGRHRDWQQQIAYATKVDSMAPPLFTPDHPAYRNTTTACWWIGECPYEASATPDCPYHRTYCKCIDPTDEQSFRYIVYADSNPCEIGPFNYMQGEKLIKFFETQSETKDKLMLVDEDLYDWLCIAGRDWRIDSMTMKKLENTPMPKRLSWDVEDYVRGYQKGRVLKQVEQFQDLADRNERVAVISCQARITKQLLETLRKKCETGPAEANICYCQADMPETPEDTAELVECKYNKCPIQFFHRHCVEKLGYDKVTTWYCGYCEKNISVAAQKALHGAYSISMDLPAPDLESMEMKGQMRIIAKRSDILLMGHCGRC